MDGVNKMPMPHIGEYREKKQDNAQWYLLAILIGLAIFFIGLISTKTLIFLTTFIIKIAKENTIIFGVVILILLFFKIKSRSRKKRLEARRNEYSDREV